MQLAVPPTVDVRLEGDVLVVRGAESGEERLGGSARTVFELVARGADRDEIVGTLGRDPFVGPIRASDVYDSVVGDLLARQLIHSSRSPASDVAVLAARAPQRVYPWYDSPWLGRWMGTRDLAARERPELVDEIVSLAEPLRTDPAFETQALGRIADDAMLDRMRTVIDDLDPALIEQHEGDAFGRTLVHNHPVFNEIQQSMLGLASEAAGEQLEISYNFLSLYTNLGVCAPHMDAPSAKYTLDLCIEQSDPWPIHISQVVPWPEDYVDTGQDWAREIKESPENHFRSYVLEPGDAIFFAGSSQWHYRDPHPKNEHGFCNLIFFHYVPKGTSAAVRTFGL